MDYSILPYAILSGVISFTMLGVMLWIFMTE